MGKHEDWLPDPLFIGQGVLHLFVPLGQDVEMTPGGESGLCSRLLDWEGQGLVFTDEIPRHTQTHCEMVA